MCRKSLQRTMHWTLSIALCLVGLFAFVLLVGALLPWSFHGTVRFVVDGLSQADLFAVRVTVWDAARGHCLCAMHRWVLRRCVCAREKYVLLPFTCAGGRHCGWGGGGACRKS